MKEDFGFISTKLKIPAPRRNYILRAHLHKRLEGICRCKVTVVKGAAGSGKTTLLSSYIKESNITSFRWITLDEDNNNIFSFWRYFLEAVKGFLGESGEKLISSFKAALREEDVEPLIALLINQLDIREEIVVVLDDFQKLQDIPLLNTIEFFLRYSPENVHLVLLTREETTIYTGDLAMSGSLLRIDETDLKLSEPEGIDFLKKTLQVDFNEDTLKQINLVSEGWIGGIQLIALASAGKNNFIGNIKVLSKHTVDYLSREILHSLSEEEKDFFIKTSILSYFNAAICSRLLGADGCEKLISALIEKNLFILQVDEEQCIYRYHTILSEFLQHKFSEMGQEIQKDLHRKASEVFEDMGDYEESIRHLFCIGDYGKAMEIIAKMEQGPGEWVLLSRIPLEYIKEDKDLAYQRFFYHYCNLEWDQCKNLLDAVAEKVERDSAWKSLKFARAFLYEMDFEIDILSLDEIENMQMSDTTKAIIYIKTASFLHIQDKNREALEFLDKVEVLEKRFNNPYIQYFIWNMKSQIKEDLGDLLECRALYEETLALIGKHAFMSPLMENHYIGITGICLKNMELEEAEQSLEKAVQYMSKSFISTDIAYLYNLMELKVLKGEKTEAMSMIKKLMDSVVYHKLVYASALIKYMLYLGNSDMQLLEDFIRSYESTDSKYIRSDDRLTYSKALYMRGQDREAFRVIDQVLESARKTKTKYKLVEAILMKAGMLQDNFGDHRREILNLLREAVYYSYENRILSPFALAGKGIVKALALLKEERLRDLNAGERNFIQDVYKRFGGSDAEEILSERETEVLRELATGASNREIGERLCISVSTVKTHVINIYSKLQVSNRIEAFEKARELGIY